MHHLQQQTRVHERKALLRDVGLGVVAGLMVTVGGMAVAGTVNRLFLPLGAGVGAVTSVVFGVAYRDCQHQEKHREI